MRQYEDKLEKVGHVLKPVPWALGHAGQDAHCSFPFRRKWKLKSYGAWVDVDSW